MNQQFKVFLIFVVVVILLAILWGFTGCFPLGRCPWVREEVNKDKPKKVVLNLVGVWDSPSDWSDVIQKFREYELANRGLDVTVQYEQIDSRRYEGELLDRQIDNNSPNMFLIFNTWLPRYEKRVVAMPIPLMDINEYKKTFAKVAYEDLVIGDKIYSMPLYVDTLGLYYNREFFRNIGYTDGDTPQNWHQFINYVERFTAMDANNRITRLGATFGGAKMVNRSQDIVMLLVMQNNANANKKVPSMQSLSTLGASQAVQFYTDFANPSFRGYTWDYNNQLYSVDAFLYGKAAMSINYSYEIRNIANKTGNTLDYGVAPVPQPFDSNKINFASYWSPVVAKNAPCQKDEGVSVSCEELSWEFINFATKADNAQLYLFKTGRPAANLELAKQQADRVNDNLSVFAQQVFTAKSLKNPYNDKSDNALEKMIDSIITTKAEEKRGVAEAIATVIKEVPDLK